MMMLMLLLMLLGWTEGGRFKCSSYMDPARTTIDTYGYV
jgi:hypothetical protein